MAILKKAQDVEATTTLAHTVPRVIVRARDDFGSERDDGGLMARQAAVSLWSKFFSH